MVEGLTTADAAAKGKTYCLPAGVSGAEMVEILAMVNAARNGKWVWFVLVGRRANGLPGSDFWRAYTRCFLRDDRFAGTCGTI